MKGFKNSLNIGSLVGWGVVIWLVIIIFGLGQPYPANFITTTTIFSLLFVIHRFSREIDDLKKQIRQKEEEWKAVDFEERLKALKKIERK